MTLIRPEDPQHPVAALLELVGYLYSSDLVSPGPEVLADRLNVG